MDQPQVTRRLSVIGLGYVGLPVAVTFAQAGITVIGFDIDAGRIRELTNGHDRTREVDGDRLNQATLRYTHDPAALRKHMDHLRDILPKAWEATDRRLAETI